MVMVRPVLQFRTDLPDDCIEDENDIIQFPGKGVTEVIRDMLMRLGHEVSEPIEAGPAGWELNINAAGYRFWIRVSLIDDEENYISTSEVTYGFPVNHLSYQLFLRQLDSELRQDGRFHLIGWFRDQKDPTRSQQPVSD